MSVPDESLVIGLLGPVAIGVLPPRYEPGPPPDLRPVPGVRAQRLLVSLALADGRTRSADRLIGDVWGGERPRSPTAALHTQISRLRQILGPGRLMASGNGYRLTGCRTDLEIVAELLSGSRTDAVVIAEQWWRGTPPDDLDDAVPGGLADELRLRTNALADSLRNRRISLALVTGDFSTARVMAEKRCGEDGLDEPAHLDLMRALAGEGRIADALAVFARLRRRLSAELGVDPGTQITAFNAQLLVADSTVGTTVDDSAASTPIRRRSPATGLLVETTALIGRDADIASIGRLLDTHRLVTVQGPGGVGKTRVANRVGARLAAAGRPVFYVSLAPVRNDDDVVAAIAAALGVGDTEISSSGRPRLTVGDLEDRLADALRGTRALVILDNCEQVIGRCARVVADLLATEPQIAVLATSRAPLMVGAEQIYALAPLDVSADGAAVELFCTRARAIRPDVTLPAAVIADVCRRLDGLPLAIELAAARTRTMTVVEIAERLAERFALLRAADPTAPDRHRTLYAVIEWSWDLLEPGAHNALRHLCRFPAGFTADAAAVVLGKSELHVHDELEALVNQSLLSVMENGGRMRYRMLETVREFGDSKIDETESARIDSDMSRWARNFAITTLASEHIRAVDKHVVDAVGAEAENLIWVLRQAYASQPREAVFRYDELGAADAETVDTIVAVFALLSGWWAIRGLNHEVLTWAQRVLHHLPLPPDEPDLATRRRWQATLMWGFMTVAVGDIGRTVGIARYYLRRLHRPACVYSDPLELVSAILLSPKGSGAARHVLRGVRSADRDVAMVAMSMRMALRENQGHLSAALADGLWLRELAATGTDQWFIAMDEMRLGSIFGQQGYWAQAAEHYRAAVSSLGRLGAGDDMVQATCNLVAALVASGDLDDAVTQFDSISAGWHPADPDPQGDPEVVGAMMVTYADLELARGAVDLAEELFWRAGTLLIREHPRGAADPALVMYVAVATVGLMSVGAQERAGEFVPTLVDAVVQMFSKRGWRDVPQAATAALAIGFVFCADPRSREEGIRLLTLARRLNVRRDYRTLDEGLRRAVAATQLSDAEWESRLAASMTVSRRQAAAELQAILAPKYLG
ncbi:MAG: BTAD domain-containing putative transcriptional regulator [Gordonia sp. (in: high G+C Gram-positive bacteria)]